MKKYKTGIYKIVNKVNGKTYYGSAKDFDKRWTRHKHELDKNKHHNSYLQASWNKYGEDNFEFIKILLCDDFNLLMYEQLFLDKYFDKNVKCYNLRLDVQSPMGRQITEITKKKLSEANTGKKRTEETKKKISLAKIGKKHTEESKYKMSLAQKGRKHTEETKCKISNAKIGNKNSFYGKSHTNESKVKISLAGIGNKYSLGFKHTEETKKKVILANISRKSKNKYKGVSKAYKGWRARINFNGKEINLGTYSTQFEASLAYDFAAIYYYGKNAYLNGELMC